MQLLGGRYRLDRPVGRGGMAVVWSAHDLVLRRTVAVKMLSELPANDRPDEDTARREALAAARLSHPHIAGVYDYGETGESGRRKPFLVMEFVSGPTLADRIADDGALDWREAATICAQVADALAAAHDSGLVHRDIKPGNVMLPTTGVKVVDFGVAAAAGDDPADVHGRIWGTPGYLAPEQLGNGRVLPAGDIHAVGLLLYECLAGHPPWRSAGVAEVLEEAPHAGAGAARATWPSRFCRPALPGVPATRTGGQAVGPSRHRRAARRRLVARQHADRPAAAGVGAHAGAAPAPRLPPARRLGLRTLCGGRRRAGHATLHGRPV